jgi:hypothetical protein
VWEVWRGRRRVKEDESRRKKGRGRQGEGGEYMREFLKSSK